MRAIPQGIYIPNFSSTGSADLSKVSEEEEEEEEEGEGEEDTTLSTIVPTVTRKRLVRSG